MIFGKPGIRNPSAGRSTCDQALLSFEVHLGQQRLQLAQPLAPRRRRLRPAQNHAQVGLQPPLDGIVQREINGLPRRLALGQAALKALRRRPNRRRSRLLESATTAHPTRRAARRPSISNPAHLQGKFVLFISLLMESRFVNSQRSFSREKLLPMEKCRHRNRCADQASRF